MEEILVFELEGRRFGVRTSDVREVLRAATPVALPEAPSLVEGVLNVRGEIVAVLDTRRCFALAPRPMEASDHLIVSRAGGRSVALRVDRALELVHVDGRAVADAARFSSRAGAIAGVAITADGLVFIQDPALFLSAAESAALEGALAALERAETRP